MVRCCLDSLLNSCNMSRTGAHIPCSKNEYQESYHIRHILHHTKGMKSLIWAQLSLAKQKISLASKSEGISSVAEELRNCENGWIKSAVVTGQPGSEVPCQDMPEQAGRASSCKAFTAAAAAVQRATKDNNCTGWMFFFRVPDRVMSKIIFRPGEGEELDAESKGWDGSKWTIKKVVLSEEYKFLVLVYFTEQMA